VTGENFLIRDHMPATYFAEYQQLRSDLMETLTDEDLTTTLGGNTLSLGAICREIGEIEYSYVESFRTFTQDFTYRNEDPGSRRASRHSSRGMRSSIATCWRPSQPCRMKTPADGGSRVATSTRTISPRSRRPSSTSIARRC